MGDDPALDEDHAFPADLFATARQIGLLEAPLPTGHGGHGLANDRQRAGDLCDLLRIVGAANLSLGRLYEGHVNALALIGRYGRPEQIAKFAQDVRDGHLFGVWNTEIGDGLRLGEGQLAGGKVYASGAGWVTRPLVTARNEQDQVLMVIPSVPAGERADLSRWQAHGMRASASGALDFTGIAIGPEETLGEPGDYHRQPLFSAGAWRFAAVQQGGIERVFDTWREHMRQTGRGGDPHQQARLGQAAIQVETARLWVERAAGAEHLPDAEQAVAYVNLARLAVERAGLDVLELAHRSVGLAGFMRTHPLERLSRDLATYLRQPAPDRALTQAAAYVLDRDVPSFGLWNDAR
ncbi:acyl-CoA dehydrogenase family protein [Geminicoccus roseus]|uniref:acyl-CoA dehydrogenase family protein n=1 Tax=Geminicoccus roseus TaxID=404900 RepID=UPI003898E895